MDVSWCGQKVENFSDVKVVCDLADELDVVGDLKEEDVVPNAVGEKTGESYIRENISHK